MTGSPPPAPVRLHASCIVIGESGLLVRGPAGSGKTTLCLALLEQAKAGGRFARLVADDRTELRACHGRLLASAVPAIAGLIERRGLGLVPASHEAAARVRLVVDCQAETPPRLPDAEDLVTVIAGLTLPRLAVSRGAADAGLVLAALALFDEDGPLR
ncbi:MAG: HPr kinase/phosphatase C-terminal domain-containing protein [Beijerinckiaceae bacterium]|jgi:serine kinase of HPr protein (carbohydrate metabolism regulator)|nr:HPr kinase/phosphatase C-terminal domain-containing protein [Beijerinckiaceae bacterium]